MLPCVLSLDAHVPTRQARVPEWHGPGLYQKSAGGGEEGQEQGNSYIDANNNSTCSHPPKLLLHTGEGYWAPLHSRAAGFKGSGAGSVQRETGALTRPSSAASPPAVRLHLPPRSWAVRGHQGPRGFVWSARGCGHSGCTAWHKGGGEGGGHTAEREAQPLLEEVACILA